MQRQEHTGRGYELSAYMQRDGPPVLKVPGVKVGAVQSATLFLFLGS